MFTTYSKTALTEDILSVNYYMQNEGSFVFVSSLS